jgi:hypothetical protein
MTQRITLDPEPPIRGQSVTICYEFDGSGLTEVVLAITFSPPPVTVFRTVTTTDPCADVDVPDGAQSITVADESGTSPDKVSPVE